MATLVAEIGDEVDLSPLPRLFERLVEFRDRRPVMRRASRDELIAAADGSAELVDRLVRARLLHVGEGQGAATIRIAHDTLRSHWDELGKWIKGNEYDLSLRDEIKRDAEIWASRGRRQADVRINRERLEEIDDLLRDKPKRFDSHSIIGAYLEASHIRAERERLITSVKGGHVTNACAAMRRLRELGVTPLLEVDHRGDENHQLKPAFWAAITGSDLPDEMLLHRSRGDIGPRPDDPSIFDGKNGRLEMARKTSQGLTPIIWASIAGQERLVRKLAAAGANLATRTEFGGTNVELASIGGHLPTVSFLVEEVGIDPLKRGRRDGAPAIAWSIQERHHDLTNIFSARDNR